MSAADLLEDGFPHSTPEGYARGCRGSRCRGIEDHGWSCTYAMQQYRGDYHWRQWIDQGATPAEIAVLRGTESAKTLAQPPKFRTVATVTVADSQSSTTERPKPRPVPNPAASVQPVVADEYRWRVTRRAEGVWFAIGGGRKRGRRFSSHAEAIAFAVEQACLEKRIREMHAQGWSDGRMAAELGVHQRALTERRQALRLPTLFRGRGRVA